MGVDGRRVLGTSRAATGPDPRACRRDVSRDRTYVALEEFQIGVRRSGWREADARAAWISEGPSGGRVPEVQAMPGRKRVSAGVCNQRRVLPDAGADL